MQDQRCPAALPTEVNVSLSTGPAARSASHTVRQAGAEAWEQQTAAVLPGLAGGVGRHQTNMASTQGTESREKALDGRGHCNQPAVAPNAVPPRTLGAKEDCWAKE